MYIGLICSNTQRIREPIWKRLEQNWFPVPQVVQPSDIVIFRNDIEVIVSSEQPGRIMVHQYRRTPKEISPRHVDPTGMNLEDVIAELRGRVVSVAVEKEDCIHPISDNALLKWTTGAEALAIEHNINLENVPHAGPKITRPDVKAYIREETECTHA